MGLFKKSKHSTLRFVKRAVELDHFHLFGDMDFTVAISKMTDWCSMPPRDHASASAFGVLHDIYGFGHPLLPVEVRFEFGPSRNSESVGSGWVHKALTFGEEVAYQAEIEINDPDRCFFNSFVRAFEHAAMSGNQYAHIVFHRNRKRGPNLAASEAHCKEHRAKIEALMKRVDEQDCDLPSIDFSRVSFEDSVTLKAPSWSRDWYDETLNRVKYHDRETAKWRSMEWRP